MKNQLSFRITDLVAIARDGILLEWRQHKFHSGPLMIELDPDAKEPSIGSLDYLEREARAKFHVNIKFPECARMLQELGARPEFCRPFCAGIYSTGPILEDHSFFLSGVASMDGSHALFDDHMRGSVLPGI